MEGSLERRLPLDSAQREASRRLAAVDVVPGRRQGARAPRSGQGFQCHRVEAGVTDVLSVLRLDQCRPSNPMAAGRNAGCPQNPLPRGHGLSSPECAQRTEPGLSQGPLPALL